MRQKRAFTLIELVMVMVLIAIMAATVSVVISSYQTQHLRAAVERIANDLRYAKSLALSSSKWTGIAFQASPTNTYNIYQTDGTTDTKIKFPQYPTQDYIVNLNNDYKGVGISSVNISSGSKVEFDPYGTPYDDKNGSALAATGVITLSGNGSSVTINISAATGRIYIQ